MFLYNSAQAVVLFLAEECQRKEAAAPYRPILPSGSNQDTRIHRNDVTSTSRPTGRGKSSQERGKSPTDLTEVRVINNSNARTSASYIVCLCALVTVVLNER